MERFKQNRYSLNPYSLILCILLSSACGERVLNQIKDDDRFKNSDNKVNPIPIRTVDINLSRMDSLQIVMPESYEHLSLNKNVRMTRAISFSPDSRRVLVGSIDGQIVVWNTANGQMEFVLNHGNEIATAAWLSNTRLIVAGTNGKIRVWNAENQQMLYEKQLHNTPIASVTPSPDGQRVLTVSNSHGQAILWDAESGEANPLTGTSVNGTINAGSFSDDGKRIAISSFGGITRVIELDPWSTFIEIPSDSEPFSLVFGGQGDRLMLLSMKNHIVLWAQERGISKLNLPEKNGAIVSAHFLDEGKVAIVSRFGMISILDTNNNVRPVFSATLERIIGHAMFDSSGRFAFLWGDDQLLFLWDILRSELIQLSKHACRSVFVSMFSNDSRFLAIDCSGEKVELFRLKGNISE